MAKVGRKFGFKHSAETKAKMRLSHLGKTYNMSTEGSKKLSRLTKGWTFVVVTDQDESIASKLISSQAEENGKNVPRKVQRSTGEDAKPISRTRVPETVAAIVLLAATTIATGYDMIRHSGEIRRGWDKESSHQHVNEISKEINYKIVNHLQQIAAAGAVQWDRTPAAGVPWLWHKESLYDAFIQVSNLIFDRTQRRNATWIVAGTGVCDVIETLSKFKSSGQTAKAVAGMRKIGTIGEFDVYKDPTRVRTTWVMGFKGSNFLDTGYIYAPYQGLYTTQLVVLDDMIARKAMAQRVGLKVVNAGFYGTGTITQSGGPFAP